MKEKKVKIIEIDESKYTTSLNSRIPINLNEKIEKIIKERNVSKSNFIRDALWFYIKNYEGEEIK